MMDVSNAFLQYKRIVSKVTYLDLLALLIFWIWLSNAKCAFRWPNINSNNDNKYKVISYA